LKYQEPIFTTNKEKFST